MKGIKRIRISNRVARYDFELRRNITVVRGDSGTGKTTLFNMVADYTRNKEQSGVNISAPCPCVALTDTNWEAQLRDIHESVVFIDEESDHNYLSSKDFARAVQNSDNYYVLITRVNLHDLPYSVEEIYEIKASGKFHKFRNIYSSKFAGGYLHDEQPTQPFNVIVTEDAKSGFQFFQAVFEDNETVCIPAGANSNIHSVIRKDPEGKTVVIADGAAFGSEIDRVLKLEKSGFRICLYLPESFEWIILRSGLIDGVEDILVSPSEYIDSQKYLSWERYFTALLTERTQDGYLAYRKAKLNENYLNDNEVNAILSVLPEVIRRERNNF
jgi:hypothetical protein